MNCTPKRENFHKRPSKRQLDLLQAIYQRLAPNTNLEANQLIKYLLTEFGDEWLPAWRRERKGSRAGSGR